MTLSTTNYDMFKFRDDNREKIDHAHVKRIANSIKSKNMLDLKPIVINSQYEIIDGQHRCLAAKQLNVPIYYTIQKDIKVEDIVLLQMQKQWRMADFVNFYAKNGKPEYIKLAEFCKKHELNVSVGIALVSGNGSHVFEKIRQGEFSFIDAAYAQELEDAQNIVDIIKNNGGYITYLKSTKFWKALINIVKHPDYNHRKMIDNLRMHIMKVGVRATGSAYIEMFLSIHNYRNSLKIILDEKAIAESEE